MESSKAFRRKASLKRGNITTPGRKREGCCGRMFGIESWLPVAALWPPGGKALFTALPGFTVGHTPGISHHTAFSLL